MNSLYNRWSWTGKNGEDIIVCNMRGGDSAARTDLLIRERVMWSCGRGQSAVLLVPNAAIFMLHQSSCLNESSVHV